jgi:hypothetical protein
VLLLLVPFTPGLRDIPRWIPVHRLIWRDRNRTATAPDGLPVSQSPTQPSSKEGQPS